MSQVSIDLHGQSARVTHRSDPQPFDWNVRDLDESLPIERHGRTRLGGA